MHILRCTTLCLAEVVAPQVALRYLGLNLYMKEIMSDELTNGLQVAGYCITASGGTMVLAICLMHALEHEPGDERRKKWFRRLRIFLPLVGLAYLWFPWVGYGSYRLSKWSLNGIDYLERPADVIPKRNPVIDLNK